MNMFQIEILIQMGIFTHDQIMDVLGVKYCNAPDVWQRTVMSVIGQRSGVAIVQDRGTAFQFLGPMVNGAHGAFAMKARHKRLAVDAVIMNTDANSPYWFHVLFHELTHATGTKERLHRVGMPDNILSPVSIEYMFEECIADACAQKLMDYYGLSTPQTRDISRAYVDMYRRGVEQVSLKPFDYETFNVKVDQAFEFIVNNWILDLFSKKDSSFAA